jgi:hypothetical protein
MTAYVSGIGMEVNESAVIHDERPPVFPGSQVGQVPPKYRGQVDQDDDGSHTGVPVSDRIEQPQYRSVVSNVQGRDDWSPCSAFEGGPVLVEPKVDEFARFSGRAGGCREYPVVPAVKAQRGGQIGVTMDKALDPFFQAGDVGGFVCRETYDVFRRPCDLIQAVLEDPFHYSGRRDLLFLEAGFGSGDDLAVYDDGAYPECPGRDRDRHDVNQDELPTTARVNES